MEGTETPRPIATSMPRVLINSRLEPKEEKWRPGGGTKAPAEDLKEFPTWGLPEDLQRVIKEVADGYQCDPSIVTAAIFSAAGTALGKSVVGYSDNYRNHPALWFVIVGKASSGKSAPVEWVYKPLMEHEIAESKRYKADHAKWESLPRENRGDTPRLHSKIAGNITDEKLLYKLADNNGALCWKHDEFATLLGGMGKYSNGGAGMIVGNLLSIFSGADFSKESVSGEPMMIEAPALNIITTTQPTVLKRLMAPYLQNGFFERFLYIHIAGKVPDYKPVRITDEASITWVDYIDCLLRNNISEIRENKSAYDIHVNAMNRWRDEERLMMDCNSGDLYEDVCCSILEKANYHLCRLSIIVAILNGCNIITAPVMQYAVDCVDYLINGQKVALLKVLQGDKRGEPTLADTIRQLYRIKPDLNQSALAESLGTSPQYVNKVVKQQRVVDGLQV